MSTRMSQEEFEKRIADYTKNTVDVISTYVNKHTKVTIKCKKCGYEWEISPLSIMPSNTTQHSFIGCQKCKYQEVECDYCHKKFNRLKSQLNKDNKTGKVFCSKVCSNRYKNERTLKLDDGAAYRRNAFNTYKHECAICGYNEDERILEVHHLDENRDNNKIENLVILCPNCHKKLTLHLYSFQELMDKYIK